MIDTHTHLEPSEAREVLDRARAAGVSRFVVVATSIAGARDALELAAGEDGVYAALGIHPHNAGGDDDASGLAELRELLARRPGRGGRRDRSRLLPRLRPA